MVWAKKASMSAWANICAQAMLILVPACICTPPSLALEIQLRGWVPLEVRKLSPACQMTLMTLPYLPSGSSTTTARSGGRPMGDREMPVRFFSKSWL